MTDFDVIRKQRIAIKLTARRQQFYLIVVGTCRKYV